MRGISLTQASSLIKHTIDYARQINLPPMSLVILDSGGYVKASVSEDGVGTLRFDIARGKANAALGMGFNTDQFSELLRQGILTDSFSNALVGAANGLFNPNPGGVLILTNQEVIGAIGASGANAQSDHKIVTQALTFI